MRSLTALALVAAFTGPALASDLVIHKEKHSDPISSGSQTVAAHDSEQVLWLGKDRMRSEDGKKVTIVRADLKKMFLLDTDAKTYSTVDLPVDLMKYVPPDYAPMMAQMQAMTKVTLAPTGETRKVKDWNATRYTLTAEGATKQSSSTSPEGTQTSSVAMVQGIKQDIWVTKDVGAGFAGWQDMYAATMSTSFSTLRTADEMRKLDGFPVLIESSRSWGGHEIKSREAVTSIEEKDPPAGLYEVPAGFTEKPFNPMGGGGVTVRASKQ